MHRRAQRRRAPAGRRRDRAQEVDEGDRGQRARREQRVERLVGVELGQRGAHPVHGRRARRGRPGRAGVRDGQDLVAIGFQRRACQPAGEDDVAQARVDAGGVPQPEVLDAGVLVFFAVQREHREPVVGQVLARRQVAVRGEGDQRRGLRWRPIAGHRDEADGEGCLERSEQPRPRGQGRRGRNGDDDPLLLCVHATNQRCGGPIFPCGRAKRRPAFFQRPCQTVPASPTACARRAAC